MIIEWHTHVYPPEETGDNPTFDGKSGPGWGGRCPMTVENVLDAHHRAKIDISVVSNAAHYMRGKPEAEELKAIRPELDGNAVMALLGVKPGPVVGRALAFLMEIRLEEGLIGEKPARARLLDWWSTQPDR